MRLPFISRRRAQTALRLAEIARHQVAEEADKLLRAERAVRVKAEAGLAAERERFRRATAYVEQAEDGRYENGVRLARALRAAARYRAEAAIQRRVIDRLTDQLLDATGNQGEPLLSAARTALGIDTKKDAK
jgi:hypothetical protein